MHSVLAEEPEVPFQSIQSIRILDPKAADEHRPSRIIGVITFYSPTSGDVFVSDGAHGIYVESPTNPSAILFRPGDRVIVEGKTAAGEFAPFIHSGRIQQIGTTNLPPVETPDWDELTIGRYDGSWIQLTGEIEQLDHNPDMVQLYVRVPGGISSVLIPTSLAGSDWTNWVGATVRATGVSVGNFNQRRQQTGQRLLVPTKDFIAVLKAPKDPWDAEAIKIGHLFTHDPTSKRPDRLKFHGSVSALISSHSLTLEDDTGGLVIDGIHSEDYEAGDEIEAVGFCRLFLGCPVLERGLIRKLNKSDVPKPVKVRIGELMDGNWTGQRVELEATVLQEATRTRERYPSVICRIEKRSLKVILAKPGARLSPAPVDSRVHILATPVSIFDLSGNNPETTLYLARPSDFTVLSYPFPWKIILLALVAITLVTTGAITAWNFTLRVQVRNKTFELGREKFEAELLAEEARAADRAKTVFLGAMSHQLRTPLNGVVGALELVLQGPLNPAERRYAESALKGVNALVDRLSEILSFSELFSGKLQLQPQFIDLRSSVEEWILSSKNAARAKKVGFRMEWGPDLPIIIRADPVRLRQLLEHLLGNAVLCTEGGEVALQITASATVRSSSDILFRVRDNGAGIPPELLDQTFEPFLDRTTTDAGEPGFGLNLAIAQRLAMFMGGMIRIESNSSQGTVYCFTLPQLPPNSARSGRGETRPNRVLLIETDEVSGLRSKLMLRQMGHEATIVPSGSDPYDWILNGKFSMALVNLNPNSRPETPWIQRIREEENRSRRRQQPMWIIGLREEQDGNLAPPPPGIDRIIPSLFTAEQLRAALPEHN